MAYCVSDQGVEYINSTKDFKEGVTQKFLNRGNRSANEIAQETGVTIKTLYNWAEDYAKDTPMKKKTRSTFEKMKIVITYSSLPESEKGEFLRKTGLFDQDIEKWQQEVLEGKIENFTESMSRKELQKAQQELDQTKKELRRKDKALAEAAALLILKKKAEDFWGEDEE